MNDLFGNKSGKYPESTGFKAGSDTSEKSAQTLDDSGRADEYKAAILEAMKIDPDYGSTVDEMTIYLKKNGFPQAHNGTVAGQFVSLEKLFSIKKSSEKRRSTSGRDVTVYVLHDGTPYEIPKTRGELLFEQLQVSRNFIDGLVKANQIKTPMFEKRAREIVEEINEILKG